MVDAGRSLCDRGRVYREKLIGLNIAVLGDIGGWGMDCRVKPQANSSVVRSKPCYAPV
jgi:hypothetical protein